MAEHRAVADWTDEDWENYRRLTGSNEPIETLKRFDAPNAAIWQIKARLAEAKQDLEKTRAERDELRAANRRHREEARDWKNILLRQRKALGEAEARAERYREHGEAACSELEAVERQLRHEAGANKKQHPITEAWLYSLAARLQAARVALAPGKEAYAKHAQAENADRKRGKSSSGKQA